MKKARAIDRKIARTIDVTTMGIAVRVALDADDRPLRANATVWGGSENDRLATLAVPYVLNTIEHAAESAQRKHVRTKAADKSAETRAAANHPANAWFALALAEDPNRGMKKLVHAARRLALAAQVEPAARDEITDDRARRFLYRQRNPPQ